MTKRSKRTNSVYSDFHYEWDYWGCWYCGWKRGRCAPFYPYDLEVAHLIGGRGRRKEDVRAIILLCTWCHKRAHGERVVVRGKVLPRITLAEMLWLKRNVDFSNYDRAWLRTLKRDLPRARRPKGGIYASARN